MPCGVCSKPITVERAHPGAAVLLAVARLPTGEIREKLDLIGLVEEQRRDLPVGGDPAEVLAGGEGRHKVVPFDDDRRVSLQVLGDDGGQRRGKRLGDGEVDLQNALRRQSRGLRVRGPVMKGGLLFPRGHRLECLDDVVDFDDRSTKTMRQRIAEPSLAAPRRASDQQNPPGGMPMVRDIVLHVESPSSLASDPTTSPGDVRSIVHRAHPKTNHVPIRKPDESGPTARLARSNNWPIQGRRAVPGEVALKRLVHYSEQFEAVMLFAAAIVGCSLRTDALLSSLPETVGGHSFDGVQVVDDSFPSGHPVDDVLAVLGKRRPDAAAVFRYASDGSGTMGAITVNGVDAKTLLDAVVDNWAAPAVIDRSLAESDDAELLDAMIQSMP
jgi:hypothetical protein